MIKTLEARMETCNVFWAHHRLSKISVVGEQQQQQILFLIAKLSKSVFMAR